MLERGDVVVYKFQGGDNKMDGTMALVLSPAEDEAEPSVYVQLLELGQPHPWHNTAPYWSEKPWFNVKNCQKIGHIDLPPAD